MNLTAMPQRISAVLLLAFSLAIAPAASAALTEVTAAGTVDREDDLPMMALAPDGSMWLAFMSYSDRRDDIGLRQYKDGKWGNLQWVPNTSGDSWHPQIAVDADGRVWVVWAQQRDENWDIYARNYNPSNTTWGEMHRLSDDPQPDMNPRLANNGRGQFAVVWQGFRAKNSNIFLKTFDGKAWSSELAVTARPANEWEPAVAYDSKDTIWVAYDSYKNGNYDIYLTGVKNGKVTVAEMPVAASPLFEVRPTVAVDRQDRVWVAWESGGANWGKDTGFNLRPNKEVGVVIGSDREVGIRCWTGGQWQAPAQPLQATFSAADGKPGWTYQPHVFSDSKGNIWVAAKLRFNVSGQGTGNRGYWEYLLTRYDGRAWTRAETIPHSIGRSSTRLNAVSDSKGDLWFAWPTDNRTEAYYHRPIRNEVYVGKLTPPGEAPSPSLTAPQNPQVEVKSGHPNEAADLDAMRGYRTTVHGRPVQIVRGDFHRHTELSWDGGGGNDGSLQDFYRYMIDAAAMDFGASTDHQGGAFEYWWWFTQKMTDMHFVRGAYTAIFGYERSVTYPFGHHNVFFADRSGEVTPFFMKNDVDPYALGKNPIGDEPGVGTGDVVANDTLLLYDEVRRMGGLTISHTSGTRMGTDWRFFNREMEPVVEIFQGARTNYEYEGAPLSTTDPKTAPGGYEAAGYVNLAFEKGYRMGITASSDHGSTHYTYTMVYTDRPTREGILDAIRRRHTYGATDNILLDVRMGEHFMGDDVRTDKALPLRVKVRGTNKIEKVHVLKDGKVVYTNTPGAQDANFEYTDNQPPDSGTVYYYVRVEQTDGQVAWGSPFWVDY